MIDVDDVVDLLKYVCGAAVLLAIVIGLIFIMLAALTWIGVIETSTETRDRFEREIARCETLGGHAIVGFNKNGVPTSVLCAMPPSATVE